MPIVDCPSCGVRQYAAVSYVRKPRCIGCEAPLGNLTVAPTRRLISGRGGRWEGVAMKREGRFT